MHQAINHDFSVPNVARVVPNVAGVACVDCSPCGRLHSLCQFVRVCLCKQQQSTRISCRKTMLLKTNRYFCARICEHVFCVFLWLPCVGVFIGFAFPDQIVCEWWLWLLLFLFLLLLLLDCIPIWGENSTTMGNQHLK